MIKNIVFDMGRVLIHWSGDMLMEKFDLSEADRAVLNEVVFGSIQWVQLDRGSITEEQAMEVFYTRLPSHLHEIARELVCFWWKQPLRPIAGMEALIQELKGNGYRIYVLSNGKCTAELSGGEITEDNLVRASYAGLGTGKSAS